MQQSRWTWRLLALPGVAWLTVFFLVAFYAVIAVAFGNQDTLSRPVPFWNPLDWNVGYMLETLRNYWHGGAFLTVSVRTIEFVVIAAGLCLLGSAAWLMVDPTRMLTSPNAAGVPDGQAVAAR